MLAASSRTARWAATIAIAWLLFPSLLAGQDRWKLAERNIKRLPPASFAELPRKIVKILQERGCTIPQPAEERLPRGARRNVIRGDFARKGGKDWAVLCSKNGSSSILVLGGKHSDCPSELAAIPDQHFLQGLSGERIGYSRLIDIADPARVTRYHQHYGGPQPPPLDHDGIDDLFVGKASVVHYCHKGKWLKLTGAD